MGPVQESVPKGETEIDIEIDPELVPALTPQFLDERLRVLSDTLNRCCSPLHFCVKGFPLSRGSDVRAVQALSTLAERLRCFWVKRAELTDACQRVKMRLASFSGPRQWTSFGILTAKLLSAMVCSRLLCLLACMPGRFQCC